MSEMLEKAARSAFCTDPAQWDAAGAETRAFWVAIARRVLMAIHEPDETMMLAVENLMPMETIKALPPGWPGLVAVHGAMIDAVLK